MRAPFPWFGGKSRAATLIWKRLGNDLEHYLEPFAGSLAVLLAGPPGGRRPPVVTLNDKDALLVNYWRAATLHPEETAKYATQEAPISELDLHARHLHLVERKKDLEERLILDPEWCDPKLAGWWLWGISLHIGSGWCFGDRGGWGVEERRLVQKNTGQGRFTRSIPALGRAPRGIHSQRGYEWQELHKILKNTRITCGDWRRILNGTILSTWKPAGILFDPPYDDGHDIYDEQNRVSSDVRAWCLEHQNDPGLRIALCGYEGEHNELESHGWTKEAWSNQGGFDPTQGLERERIWFSPQCPSEETPLLTLPWLEGL